MTARAEVPGQTRRLGLRHGDPSTCRFADAFDVA